VFVELKRKNQNVISSSNAGWSGSGLNNIEDLRVPRSCTST
jgi:hypothetical protein